MKIGKKANASKILKWTTIVVVILLVTLIISNRMWNQTLSHITDTVREEAGVKTLSTHLGKIAYQWHGPDTGQVIVMIHGFSIPSVVFVKNVHALVNAGFRVLTFDHFGRGFSDRPKRAYDLTFYEAELLAIWNELKLPDSVNLLGYSMGGGIAAHFSTNHPKKVKKLCLIAPVGMPAPRYVWANMLRIPLLAEWLANGPLRIVMIRQLRKKYLDGNLDEEIFKAFQQQFEFRGTTDGLLSTLRHFPMGNLEGVYEKLGQQTLPILVVWGDRDRVVPFRLHQPLLEKLPGAQFTKIKDAAHGIPYTHPDLISSQLLEFFGT